MRRWPQTSASARPRRALFVIAALGFPILANGVRAWGTIYVAYLTDKRFAVGFDHVVYGWIFFALVIVLDHGGGTALLRPRRRRPLVRSRRAPAEGHAARLGRGARSGRRRGAGARRRRAAWSAAVQAGSAVPVPTSLARRAGLDAVPRDGGGWVPNFSGYDAFRIGRYRDAAGHEVDLAIAVYARQEDGRELAGFGQGATRPDGAWAWTADAPAPPGGKSERIFSHGTIREVASFYRVGANILTGSRAR
jgi:hypothetical protein